MADLTALNAAVAELNTAADAVMAKLASAGTDQASVDQVTASVQAVTAKLNETPA